MKRAPDLMPQSTARKALGIENRQTVGNWIKRGHVTGYDVHGEKWVSLRECRRWIAQPNKRKR